MLLAKTSQYSLVAKWSSKRCDSRNSGRPDTPSQLAVRSQSHDPSPASIKWMQDRVARVGWKIPTVEVRYQNLTIETQAQVASRSLPTLINVARNMVESWLDVMGIRVTKKITFAILKGVSGIIKPGRMTLLLGPPSSGKTTLLLALAGRLAKNLKKSGEITYNGYKLGEFVPQKTSSYIRQYDLHEAQMTVRETLTFSARCQGVGERCDPWTELVRRENELGIHVPDPDVGFVMDDTDTKDKSNGTLPDYVLKILGLDVCADTLVGDQMRRGISGGEKKRVTTGEMIIGPKTTLFMDEISTGLDTSTTFQIIKWLANVTRIFSYTTLISLLQPAPETYNLFDDIILLSEGQVVYHGPRESILEFFEACGFKCPERKGVADFLQEVTAKKDQEQYWADKSKPYQFTTVNDFIEAYKTFRAGKTMVGELTVPFDKASSHPAALTFARYSVSTKELFVAVFAKEWLLMRRNTFVNVFKAVQIALVALICMSVFFSRSNMRINNLEDPQIFAGALFYGVVSIMFNGFSELPMTIMRLPVFYKLRDFYFFPPWAFTVSRFILSLPVSLLESSIWIILTYYTIGFAPGPDRFFRQLLVLFWVHQMSSALFRFIAGLCRTIIRSNTGGSLALLLVFIMSGFLIPRTSIKPWWIWGYWVSPLVYAQNAIEVNEFLAPRWKPYSLGVKYLLISGLVARGYWYWLCIGVMIGYTILFNVGLTFVLTVLGPEGGSQTMVEAENEEESIKQLTEPGSKTTQSNAAVKGLTNTPSLTRSISASLNARSSRYVMLAMDGATGEPRRGMVLPFQPLAISFSDVNYYVDLPKGMKAQKAKTKNNKLQLLRGITGAFRPGVLTALVGVSGAGKSTLLDVLAGRKTRGYIEGDIRIAGFPKKQATFVRVSGYCEQNDVHSPRVTVHESLTYSAWLRLPADIDQETKRMFVLEVMDLVELTPVRNRIVGLPGMNGLSTEQRKRLTIAVELVANPSIIFMDEPTSGLDARAAAVVMRTVRNTVDTGRTVVCTIHQPSIDIFEAFDELLLLKQGGQVIYSGPLGPHSHKLIQYFEAIPGVPKIPEGYNPATWMLEISSAGVEHRIQVNFGDRYVNSALFEQTKAMVQELSSDPAPDARDLWFPSHYSQPLFSQFHACLWKHNLTYWRSPDYNSVRFIFTSASGLLFGTIFWQFGKNLPEQGHLVSIMGAIFCGAFFMGIRNSATVQPIVATERTVFYRESAAGLYSAIPYAIAQVAIELPYCFVQTILYCVTTYPMMALQWTAAKFLWYMFFNFFNFVCFTFYGMMVVGLTPNQSIAAIVGAFFYSMFNLFGGFVIKRPDIPVWWIWYYWICPVAWTVYGLVASQFGDLDNIELKFGTQTNTTVAFGPPQINTTVAGFVDRVFGFKHSFLPVVAVMVVIFPALFATVFMFSIKFVNFQKR